MADRFFAPLGWRVDATAVPLDETYPEWGDSPYVDLWLAGSLRLADALNHLYVALPVLDDAKHYWIGDDEIEKLLRAGSGWLATHPERNLITRRYLGHRTALTRQAMERLAEVDDAEPETLDDAVAPPRTAAAGGPQSADGNDAADRSLPVALQRHAAVLAALRSARAQRVIDLGCGAGALLPALLAEPAFH